jgi:hypothetical protein
MDNIIDVDFNPVPDFEHHECSGTRNGDWIIFLCPQCHDYERRLNWRTGETTARNVSATIDHNGRYSPRELKEAFENAN